MGQDLGAIDTSPKEGRVGELIVTTPGQLLGKEILDTCTLYNLRELGAVTEGIWKEEDFNFLSKFFSCKLLTIEKLSNHGFT